MKKYTFIHSILYINKALLLIGVFSILLSLVSFAQDGTDATKEKSKARLGLSYININNYSPRLVASIKTKIDRSYIGVEGVRVNFYLNEIDQGNFLGYSISNNKGDAMLALPETSRKKMRTKHEFLYLAAFVDNELYKDAEKELLIVGSYISMKFDIEDSVKQVTLHVVEIDSMGEMQPSVDTEARIYVQRMYGLLPISEESETTNDDGELVIDFPNDIPGDESGKIKIIGKIEDHDEYGTLVSSQEIDWGVTMKEDHKEQERNLWSARANAPFWLIISSNLIIVGTWLVIGYVIYKLIQIKKLGYQ